MITIEEYNNLLDIAERMIRQESAIASYKIDLTLSASDIVNSAFIEASIEDKIDFENIKNKLLKIKGQEREGYSKINPHYVEYIREKRDNYTYYHTNRERELNRTKKYKQEKNYNKNHYAKNRERIKAKAAEWNKKNQDKVKENYNRFKKKKADSPHVYNAFENKNIPTQDLIAALAIRWKDALCVHAAIFNKR